MYEWESRKWFTWCDVFVQGGGDVFHSEQILLDVQGAVSKDKELALYILYVFLPLHLLHEGRTMKFCILNLLINCKSILNWVQFRCSFTDLGKMSRINVSCVMGQQSLILQGRNWKSLLFKAVEGLWTVGSVQRSAFRVCEQTNWNMSLGKALRSISLYQELDLTGIASVNNCCA